MHTRQKSMSHYKTQNDLKTDRHYKSNVQIHAFNIILMIYQSVDVEYLMQSTRSAARKSSISCQVKFFHHVCSSLFLACPPILLSAGKLWPIWMSSTQEAHQGSTCLVGVRKGQLLCIINIQFCILNVDAHRL